MKLFNRIISLSDATDLLKNRDYLFVYFELDCDKEKETRGYVSRECLNPRKWIRIKYREQGRDSEGCILDGFITEDNLGVTEEYLSLRQKDMERFVTKIYEQSKELFVDFTIVNIRFLGAFLSSLCKKRWEYVLFSYTEPQKYILDTDKGEPFKKFDMKNKTLGFEEIPGLETMGDALERSNWVVFLGFEEERLKRIEEEVSVSRDYTIPVICIPSMHVKWHNYAIDVNLSFLEKIPIAERDNISYVSSVNPFDVYNYLEQEKQKCQHQLVISPVSTKPVILGTIMYILYHNEDMLLWDSPFQIKPNTENSGNTLVYDISDYVNRKGDIK